MNLREISPELVLVDPELAPLARLHLPEPGSFGVSTRPHSEVATAVVDENTVVQSRIPERRRRKGGRSLVLLTAASLAANAVFIHHAQSSVPRPFFAAQSQNQRGGERPRPTVRGAVPRNVVTHATTQVITWKQMPKATYYDLVLWRDGKRVLDLWPTSPHALVTSLASHRGAYHRLQPGRYRWFAYPGYGSKTSHRYGKLAGSGALLVTK
jgi:hypothetical protein